MQGTTALALSVLALFAVGGEPGASTSDDLAAAVAEVRMFNFKAGHKQFTAVMNRAPAGSASWEQAVYGAAVCAQQMSPPTRAMIQKADGLYQQLLAESPDSKYAQRALINRGRIKEVSDYYQDAIDLARARALYQQVIDRWPDEPIAGEALLRAATTYIQTYDTEPVKTGIALLERWLEAYPNDPLAAVMWQYLGSSYFYPLAQHRRSLDCYINADQIGLVGKGRQGPVYWRMAVMADRLLDDRAAAVKYYTKIVTDTPSSGKGYEAQLALKRLGAPVPRLRILEPAAAKAAP